MDLTIELTPKLEGHAGSKVVAMEWARGVEGSAGRIEISVPQLRVPLGVVTSTLSPFDLPISARPMGDEIEILRSRRFASVSPTMAPGADAGQSG